MTVSRVHITPHMHWDREWYFNHRGVPHPSDQQHGGDPGELLENDFYRIALNDYGTLQILDKLRGTTFDQVLTLEEGYDDGDEYDYSASREGEGWLRYSTEFTVTREVTHQAWQSIATLKLRMALPANLDERANRQCNGHLDITCRIRVRVSTSSWNSTIRPMTTACGC